MVLEPTPDNTMIEISANARTLPCIAVTGLRREVTCYGRGVPTIWTME